VPPWGDHGEGRTNDRSSPSRDPQSPYTDRGFADFRNRGWIIRKLPPLHPDEADQRAPKRLQVAGVPQRASSLSAAPLHGVDGLWTMRSMKENEREVPNGTEAS
jgi:hypothetical protein